MTDNAGVILHKKKIACWICQIVIAYSDNTLNMTYHLQLQHLNEYEKYLKRSGKGKNSDNSSSDNPVTPVTSKQAKEDASKPSSVPKQITLSAASKREAPLPSSSPRYSSLLHVMINFIKPGTCQPVAGVHLVS